jgi:hypothetical protein
MFSEQDIKNIQIGNKVYFPGPYFHPTKWRTFDFGQRGKNGRLLPRPCGEMYWNGQLYFAYLPYLYLLAARNPLQDSEDIEAEYEFYDRDIIDNYDCFTSLSELYKKSGQFFDNRLSLAAAVETPEELPGAVSRVLCCASDLIYR